MMAVIQNQTLAATQQQLVDALREHALVIGEVVLTSGAKAQYYVDAKRALLLPAPFALVGELLAACAQEWEATAIGGLTMGADAPTCAALATGIDVKGFFVRKESKSHGLQRRIEGPLLNKDDRCLVVEDVATTGGSTIKAIEALQEAGHQICGIVTVLDRLAGARERIAAVTDVPYRALTTIDDVYPNGTE
jgi:orotate phosphoribosyltransferase